jgi:hypothetical protein
MIYPDIEKEVSQKLNIPEDVVDAAYKSFYEFVKEKITELPLKDELSEEEFSKLRTNFNIPSLGKLHCTYERYSKVKERLKYANKLKELYEIKED